MELPAVRKRLKRAWRVLFPSKEALDITVIRDEDEIPYVTRFSLEGQVIIRVFLTEDNMEDPDILRAKVIGFLNDFGMDPSAVRFFVCLTENTQPARDKEFKHEVRIFAYPKCPCERPGRFPLFPRRQPSAIGWGISSADARP